MKISIPMIKPTPGLPTLGQQLEAMTDAELEALAADCTPHETEALGRLTDDQLRGIVHATPEGKRLMTQISEGQL